MPQPPTGIPQSEHVRQIGKDIVFTILTCGLFNLYVQSRQMKAVNQMLKEEKYHFLHWFLLTLITCGIYHIYHEYRKTTDIALVMKDHDQNEALVSLLLTIFGMSLIVDAIQQTHINRYYGSTKL